MHITTQYALLRASNDGLRRAITHEKKRRKRGKALFEEFRAINGNGATFFSPAKVQAARNLQQQKEADKQAEQAEKEARKQEQRQQYLQKQQSLEQRRKERARAKDARAAAAAQKAVERQRQLHDKAAEGQLQLTLQQSVKRIKKTTKSTAAQNLQQLAIESPLKSKQLEAAPLQRQRTRRPPAYLSDYEVAR